MPTQHTPLCTAFLRHQRVAAGAYSAVAETLAGLDLTAGTFLVFDDATAPKSITHGQAVMRPSNPQTRHSTKSFGQPLRWAARSWV